MIASLTRRRVPQILGLYLGGSWVLVEFVSFLTTHYMLSDSLIDLALVALLSLLPAVTVVAWFHGTPGKDSWETTEKIIIPLNLMVSAGLIFVLFHGQELGATTTTFTAMDEEGVAVTRVAPKASQRRPLAVFFFDNRSGDPELDWLINGINLMLERDLEQNPFLNVWSPFEEFEQGGFLDLQRAGFGDGVGVPVPLMRQIAQRLGMPHMLAGSFRLDAGDLIIEAGLYTTGDGAQPAQIVVRGGDVMDAVDALTVAIASALEVPEAAGKLSPDLPLREHFTGSVEAARLYVAGIRAAALENDMDKALTLLGEAGTADPAFAAAHLSRAARAFNAGRSDIAVGAAAEATRHDYRLLPKDQFRLKAMNYTNAGQVARVPDVYRTWADLYPEDLDARANLALAYLYHANDPPSALRIFEEIRAQTHSWRWVLGEIASLRMITGDVEGAKAVLNDHIQAHPEDYEPHIKMGDIYLKTGELAQARRSFERAVLLVSGRVDPILRIADLDLREGDYPGALRGIADAQRVAGVPRQEAAILRAEIAYFHQRGMLELLAERLDRLYEIEASYRGPLNVLMMTLTDYVEHYALVGQEVSLLARIAALEAVLQPPINELVQVPYLILSLYKGDVATAERQAERVVALVERFQRDDMDYLNDLARARIAALKGDLDSAIGAAESSLAKFQVSVQSVEADEDRIEIALALGAYRLQAGDTAGAEAALSPLLKRFPAHPEVNLALARIAQVTGALDLARQRLDVCLDAWEDASAEFPPLQELRALQDELQMADGATARIERSSKGRALQ